jgi:uncharacterized protein (DUF1697 family)
MRYIAFLRGINLGKRRLSMSRLRTLFEELNFTEIETVVASGNVLFTAAGRRKAELKSVIEAHLESSLGYAADTFVRTMPELRKIAAVNPFPGETDPSYNVHVAFCQRKLPTAKARQLESITTEYDAFRVTGAEFYWLTRGPISNSEVWRLPEMKRIEMPSCTMRNRTTLRKIVEKYDEVD